MKKLNRIRHADLIRRLPVTLCLLIEVTAAASGEDENFKAQWESLRSVQKPAAAELATASKLAETFLRHCDAGRMKEALSLADPAMFARTSRDEWAGGLKEDRARNGALKSCVFLAARSLRTPPGGTFLTIGDGSSPSPQGVGVQKPKAVLTMLFQCECANGALQAEISMTGIGKPGAPLLVLEYWQVPLRPGEWVACEAALNLGLAVSLRATGAAEAEWRPLADAARRDAAICHIPLPAVPGLSGSEAKDKAAALGYFRETLPREWKVKASPDGMPDARLMALQMAGFHLSYEPGNPGNDDLLKRMAAVAGEDGPGPFPKICESKLPASQSRSMTVAVLNQWSNMLRFGDALQQSNASEHGGVDIGDGDKTSPKLTVKPPGNAK